MWQVRNLKLFLFQENVAFKEDDLPNIALEGLDALHYGIYGRAPTTGEWKLLDEKQSALSRYLDSHLRRKLRLSQMRKYFTTVPVVFLVIALISQAGGIVQHVFEMPGSVREIIYRFPPTATAAKLRAGPSRIRRNVTRTELKPTEQSHAGRRRHRLHRA